MEQLVLQVCTKDSYLCVALYCTIEPQGAFFSRSLLSALKYCC